MTALWSDPRSGSTEKSPKASPRTKAWSMRSSLGAPGQGPQVRAGRPPRIWATATAASVKWDAIPRYTGHSGVALKSPTRQRT